MSIIGNGDIAMALREGGVDRDDLLFFAAGVSNSRETRESEYAREVRLFQAQDQRHHIVYFSSLCIFYSNSRYARHKRQMENLIQDWKANTAVLRMGNITWGNNPTTLINYLRAHPEAPIRDEWRYIVDKEEFWHWMRLIPFFNCEMNIPGRRLKVADIYREFVIEQREHA